MFGHYWAILSMSKLYSAVGLILTGTLLATALAGIGDVVNSNITRETCANCGNPLNLRSGDIQGDIERDYSLDELHKRQRETLWLIL